MKRRIVIASVLLAGIVAAVLVAELYGAEIARWTAAALSGWLAWKLLLGRAGFKPTGAARRVWRLVETAWVAWVTVNVGRAHRARIRPEECQPIAKLKPVYTGPGQTDEIPY